MLHPQIPQVCCAPSEARYRCWQPRSSCSKDESGGASMDRAGHLAGQVLLLERGKHALLVRHPRGDDGMLLLRQLPRLQFLGVHPAAGMTGW